MKGRPPSPARSVTCPSCGAGADTPCAGLSRGYHRERLLSAGLSPRPSGAPVRPKADAIRTARATARAQRLADAESAVDAARAAIEAGDDRWAELEAATVEREKAREAVRRWG